MKESTPGFYHNRIKFDILIQHGEILAKLSSAKQNPAESLLLEQKGRGVLCTSACAGGNEA